MLKIFNELRLFFEDVYTEMNVRDYARKQKISPPTASRILKEFEKDGMVLSKRKGIYVYYRANREEFLFQQMSKIYWYIILKKITRDLHEEIGFRRIILFGSTCKAENKKDSDIDLFLDTEAKKIDLSKMEKELNRTIQVHFKGELTNKYLKNNIKEGMIIR